MDLSKCNVGMAITGSFCTFDKIKIEIKKMVEMGINVYPILASLRRVRHKIWKS